MTAPLKFYKLSDLSAESGLTVEYLRDLCKTEQLEAIKTGGGSNSHWLVREDWFNRWAESNKYKAA